MIIKVKVKFTVSEDGDEFTNDFIFKGDELTSATSKAIEFLQEQQQKEMVV
tara:strand:+ start:37 stop:189 length:153 start_codon:yes stop_codon:yes gene_type:complete